MSWRKSEGRRVKKEKENGVGVLDWDKEWPTATTWRYTGVCSYLAGLQTFVWRPTCMLMTFAFVSWEASGSLILYWDESIASPLSLSLERRYRLFNDAASSWKTWISHVVIYGKCTCQGARKSRFLVWQVRLLLRKIELEDCEKSLFWTQI